MRDGLGRSRGWLFEPTFIHAIMLRQAVPRITSDADAVPLREADLRLGLTADLATRRTADRDPQRIRYEQVVRLRRHVYTLTLGCTHQDEQDTLTHDVAMKLSGCGWNLKRGQQTVLKAGTRVLEHGRRVLVDGARAAGVLWHRLLRRIARRRRPAQADRDAAACAERVCGRTPRPRRRMPPAAHAHLSLVLRE